MADAPTAAEAAPVDNRAPEQLAVTIKALIRQGDAATSAAEQHYQEAGRRLTELRAMLPEGTSWRQYLTLHVGIGERRAFTLMAIAAGRTTAREERAKNRERNAACRSRQAASRDAALTTDVTRPESADATRPESTDTAQPETWDRPEPGRVLFLHQMSGAVRNACEAAEVDILIDEEVVLAVAAVVEAWSNSLVHLKRRAVSKPTATDLAGAEPPTATLN
jgi:hypothetical protein